MAYNRVGTPVFYIDNFLYHKTIGTYKEYEQNLHTNYFVNPDNTPSLYTLKPSYAEIYDAEITESIYTGNTFNIHVPLPDIIKEYDFENSLKIKFYCAVLNTNCDNYAVTQLDEPNNTVHNVTNTYASTYNATYNEWASQGYFTNLSGTSIVVCDSNIEHSIHSIQLGKLQGSNESISVGGVSMGIQYTMPHSPELNLSMEFIMDGAITTTSIDGSTITNISHTGNVLWRNVNSYTNPFDVYSDSEGLNVRNTGARRNGRRVWNLSFNNVEDTDLFSSNNKGGIYTEHPEDNTYENNDLSSGAQDSENTLAFNIETDDSFISQVWNKTLGGALPFIFQPNSNNNDEFYLCKFDENTLTTEQTAYKSYNTSVKIREVW